MKLFIPKQLEKLVFRLRQSPADRRSQKGLYFLNTNPFAIFDPRDLSRQPKNQFFKLFGYIFLITIFSSLYAEPLIDLEDLKEDFVLETKKIEIPYYPEAFNPSIIRWEGTLLMCFRVIPDPKQSFSSLLGLIFLDDEFSPIGEPQILDMREKYPSVPSRAEDGRLITIGDRLYLVYSDCTEPKVSRGGFRVYIAELIFNGTCFSLKNPECLSRYEGADPKLREKNWVPFDYNGNLLLAYSLTPHKIFHPLLGTGTCETVSSSLGIIAWNWGYLRGGTPGLAYDDEYLAFFHSWKDMPTKQSDGKTISHYFMGAYTFSRKPPFNITKISPKPIVGKGFYNGPIYKPYWKPVRVVFPGGFVMDENYIWIAYGRQDHEAWIVKLDKKKLMQSLSPLGIVNSAQALPENLQPL